MGSETRAFSLNRYSQMNANKNAMVLTLFSVKVEMDLDVFGMNYIGMKSF